MRVEETIKQFIERHQLLKRDSIYLVGVSGGADSVCLLLVLKKLGYHVEAVHCNFHLRGTESDRDELFTKTLCEKEGIAFHVTHFDTITYATLHKISIEMAARQLRYHYFEQLRRDINADGICVAHHQDDSAETILMNMIRGTGIHGLTGIKPRNGFILRPLLCVRRKEIEQWLLQQGQPYVTDSTNKQDDVVRNRLRLNVIPEMEKAQPGAVANILTTARRLAEAVAVYDTSIRNALDRLMVDNTVNIGRLLLEPSPESILFQWLNPLGFTPATIETISRRLTCTEAGRVWTSDTHQLTIHNGLLICRPVLPPRPTLLIPECGTYLYDGQHLRIRLDEGRHVSRNPQCASLDASTVDFPLTIRPVKAGDRFQPFGMKGTKLVSDYLTDRKLMLFDKQRQVVVTDRDGHIIWLVGHRPDQHFCISEKTQQTLTLTLAD